MSFVYAAAKTLLRQVNYSDSCASSSVAVSLLVAPAYSEGMEYIEVLESSAKRAHLLFRQAALLPNSSHREMHSFVFNGLGHGQLCTVPRMRAIFAQFVHSRKEINGCEIQKCVRIRTLVQSGRSAAW